MNLTLIEAGFKPNWILTQKIKFLPGAKMSQNSQEPSGKTYQLIKYLWSSLLRICVIWFATGLDVEWQSPKNGRVMTSWMRFIKISRQSMSNKSSSISSEIFHRSSQLVSSWFMFSLHLLCVHYFTFYDEMYCFVFLCLFSILFTLLPLGYLNRGNN